MAKHRTISADRLAKLHRELEALPQGEKTARIDAFAALLGMSRATVYRHLEKSRLNDTRTRKSAPIKPLYKEWTGIMMTLALKPPDGKPVALIDARAAAVAAGLIPEAAMHVAIETFHRLAREMGLREPDRKINAVAAEYAHQAVLLDASSSAYFSVVRELPDGDYLLKLNPRPHPDYKNKPVGKERLRCIVYGFWEMYSGYQWATYTVSMGENGYDAMAALLEFSQPKADPRDPVYGLMEQLWVDQGPIAKLGASVDLIERLGIELLKGEPYVKERMGGVEQTHRRRWEFERTFYLTLVNSPLAHTGEEPEKRVLTPAEKGEITLSELNARCAAHRARINANHARFQPGKTKLQAWSLSAAARARAGNPIRRLPENAIETMATEVRRRVDQHGVVRWDNQLYEVADGLHSRWVVARRALDDGRVIVEDIETGKRYETKPFVPRTLGEYRAFPKSPVDKAKELGAGVSVASPYVPAEGSNIVALPARTRAPDPLPNPLEAGKYGSLGEALRAFADWHGMPAFALDYPEEFDAAVELIQENGLSKEYVRKLALELRQAIKAGNQ